MKLKSRNRTYLVEPAVPLEPSVRVLLDDPAAVLPHLEGGAALHLVPVHIGVVHRGRDLLEYFIFVKELQINV